MSSSFPRRALGAVIFSGLLVGCGAGAASATSSSPPGPSSTAGPTTAGSSPCGRSSAAPTYRHVIWILEENRSYGGVIGSPAAPFINSLAKQCGLASNYHNITHHSLANYMGLSDGGTLTALRPFDADCSPPSRTCESAGTSLFSESSSWRAYDESMPKPCDRLGTSVYADRHNPALYYTDLKNCATNDLPLGTTTSSPLLRSLASQQTAPSFTFVTPNLCDDMHAVPGTCETAIVARGDSWLRSWIGLITSTPVYASGNTAIVIVWDEGSSGSTGESCAFNTTDQSCHVPMVVVAPSVRPGTVDRSLLNHYSLLKTTESLLGYRELGLATAAVSFKSAFNL